MKTKLLSQKEILKCWACHITENIYKCPILNCPFWSCKKHSRKVIKHNIEYHYCKTCYISMDGCCILL